MKILLINPPVQLDVPPRFPSFGIAYIVQTLKQNGYEVDFFDIDANRYSRDFVLNHLKTSKADVIGIGGLVTVYPYLAWLIPEIKKIKPQTPIIWGGPGASSLKEKCFEHFAVDFVVIGEGEVTILELLNALEHQRDFSQVKGIGFRNNNQIIFTQPRPLMASLDSLPRFDDTLFPMEKLLQNTNGIFQIHTQRGCPSNCTFCFNAFRVISRHVRYRPVEQVLDEIAYFKEKFKNKIKLFAMAGECITMNKTWLKNFTQGLLDRHMNIRYRVTSRVDTLDEERLRWLKHSGCVSLSLGLESGSDKILKIMKKNATVEENRRVVRLAKRFIPHIEASVILGYIGEDLSTLRETIQFCKGLGVRPALFFATPFPGTELYEMAKEKKRIMDEPAYWMTLDKRLISDFDINLTEFKDEDAKKEILTARNEIERYYFIYDAIHLRVFHNVLHILQTEGPKTLIKKIFRRIGWFFKKK